MNSGIYKEKTGRNSIPSGFTLVAIMISLFLYTGYQSYGQDGPGDGPKTYTEKHVFHHGDFGIPNLTDDQRAKIKDLHLELMKEVKPLHNQLEELKAREHTLATADKADIKAIDANLDEISKVTNQLMKAKAHMKQQVRGLLTDEQRLLFDTQKGGHRGFQKNHEMETNRDFEGWHHGEEHPQGPEMQK
jgi:Spy/CpxP family protein refolding chaperone